jgi:hypothetical protein
MLSTGSRSISCSGAYSDYHALFEYSRRLRTAECLDFILALPKEAILVGYFFTYDATQILLNRLPISIR